ncbi:ribosomal protein S18-alanine N-acetyltransferase [Chloroflexota bacterium]
MSRYTRPMAEGDIAPVTEIDRAVFHDMWPPVNYKNEFLNPLAHYIVACGEEITAGESPRPESGMGRWSGFRRLFGGKAPLPHRLGIIGFAGIWLMADEAHIMNLAVRESHRRRGIGEMLLITTIELADRLNAGIVTLEVRASNTAAIALYDKCGFAQVDLHRAYYLDNKEDAVLMSTEKITAATFQDHLQRLKQDHSSRWGIPLCKVTS